jgi:hypothetical protein
MKKIAKDILDVCDEVNSGFANRHSSSYLHFQIGNYSKNYEYTGTSSPKSGGSSYTGRSSTAKWDWGDRLGSCAGWDIYGKEYKDTYVYNVVKKKDTPQNKTDWDKIRGEITTETNFKWTPRTQTFARWGEIKDFEVVMSKLCAILQKYYQGTGTTMEPTPAPAPAPMPEPTSTKQLTLTDFARKIMLLEMDVFYKMFVGVNVGYYEIYDNKLKQSEYVNELISGVESLLNKEFSFVKNTPIKEIDKEVYTTIQEKDRHLLNNFLALYGLYGETLKNYYIREYQKQPDRYLAPFKKSASEPTLTQEPSKEQIERAIKGLKYLADKGDEKAMKAIKGLQYLLNK